MAEVTEALARNMCAAGWSLASREAPTPVQLPPAGPSLAPWPAPPGPLPPPKRRSPKPWWARAGPGPSIPRSAGGESQTGATAKPKTSARRLCPRLFLSTDDDDRRADFWCSARSTDASSCCCYPPLHFSFAAFRKPYSAALSCRIFCGGPACEIRRLLGVLNWRPTFSSSRLPTPDSRHPTLNRSSPQDSHVVAIHHCAQCPAPPVPLQSSSSPPSNGPRGLQDPSRTDP